MNGKYGTKYEVTAQKLNSICVNFARLIGQIGHILFIQLVLLPFHII